MILNYVTLLLALGPTIFFYHPSATISQLCLLEIGLKYFCPPTTHCCVQQAEHDTDSPLDTDCQYYVDF